LHHALVLLVRTRRIGGNIRGSIARLDELVVDQVLFDFLAANVGKHAPVDFNTWRQRLPTFGLHFPAERRILDDVLFGVWKIVFSQHSAHTGTPATIGL